MSIKQTFNGDLVIHPGAVSKIVVENLTGFPLATTGTVGVIGTAIGGMPRVLDILSRERIQDAKARYKSGPIADCFELLANPSKDGRIANGASKIVVYKVNNSLQSQLSLKNPSAIAAALLMSRNYGNDENNLAMALMAGSILDAHAVISGSIAGPYNLAGGETLIVRANGVNYTFTNTLVGGAITASALLTDLNNTAKWAGALKPVIASLAAGLINITLDPTVVTAGEKDYGYLKVDPACTLDTIVGLIGSNRGQKGSRIAQFVKGTKIDTTLELGGSPVISLLYVGAGSKATMAFKYVGNELRLQTTCTGASGDNLDLLIKDADGKVYFTLADLVNQIDTNAAYQATVLYSNAALNADQIDFYDALVISDVAAVLKRDLADLLDYVNTFEVLAVGSAVHNVYRELATFPLTFFTGASDGTMSNSDWLDAFEAMKQLKVDVVVPLISKDIGSVTIDSINALADAHARWGWSTSGKSERSSFCSKLGSKTVVKAAAKAMNSGLSLMFAQDPQVADRSGTLAFQDPWATACLAAGARCGMDVGEPLTYKYLNLNDLRVRDGSWNPKKDFAEMIEAGITFLEPVDDGGFRVVVGNTTYSTDGSFVWNRESVVQAAGFVAYDLRSQLEKVFTGTKARTGSATAIVNFIKARMTTYLDADIIVGDDLNGGLGYQEKTLRCVITGSTAAINISITPVQGLDFLLPTIYLQDIKQSA